MEFLNISLSTVCLDKEKSLLRQPPRLDQDQQYNYKELFDYYTLFSDIFYSKSGNIELLGPPLLNLKTHLEEGKVHVDGYDVKDNINIVDSNRICCTTIKNIEDSESVYIEIDGQGFTRNIQPNMSHFFLDKNVLVTQQRDNPIEWIVFWINYHIEHHNINAVLIYDNCSESYSVSQLEQKISQINAIDRCCVVDWKIPFGVTGGPKQVWDSDFGQHQFLEHALKRMLSEASCAIIGDIDELPLHENGVSIPDLFKTIEEPVLSYYRRNIVDVGVDCKTRLHSDTFMYEKNKPLAGTKYAISPKKLPKKAQLLVHRVTGCATYFCDDIISRHFGSLRVDWRNGKYSQRPLKKPSQFSNLQEDKVLVESFRKIDNEQVKKISQL